MIPIHPPAALPSTVCLSKKNDQGMKQFVSHTHCTYLIEATKLTCPFSIPIVWGPQVIPFSLSSLTILPDQILPQGPRSSRPCSSLSSKKDPDDHETDFSRRIHNVLTRLGPCHQDLIHNSKKTKKKERAKHTVWASKEPDRGGFPPCLTHRRLSHSNLSFSFQDSSYSGTWTLPYIPNQGND